MREATESPTPAQDPSLLKLPAELRNTIYRLVLEETQTPKFCWTYPWFENGRVHERNLLVPQQPSLACTCREMRDEVLSLWYSESVVAVDAHNLLDVESGNATLTLFKHPAWQIAAKHARMVKMNFKIGSLKYRYRTKPSVRFRPHGRCPCCGGGPAPPMPPREGRVRVAQGMDGVIFDADVYNRCICDLHAEVEAFNGDARNKHKAFEETLRWIHLALIQEVCMSYENNEICENCGIIQPVPIV